MTKHLQGDSVVILPNLLLLNFLYFQQASAIKSLKTNGANNFFWGGRCVKNVCGGRTVGINPRQLVLPVTPLSQHSDW